MTQNLSTVFLFLTLSANFWSIYCGKCPQNKELIEPCTCEDDKNFQCNTDEDYNLKQIFDYTRRSIHWKEKNFQKLHISNKNLKELEECSFSDINFEEIVIDNAENLSKIHTNALGSTRMHLKRLTINNAKSLTNSPPNHNIFDALSSMNNIEKIEINNINLTEIPDYAFRPLLGNQWNLKWISIDGSIQRIGNYAFYDYSYFIKNISIGSEVNFISRHAFDLRDASFEKMTIDLSDNLLRADSFEPGVFMNSKRPLLIDLSRNRLSYLDEKIFRPIIERDIMNQIILEGNPLECDCRMSWLSRDVNRSKKQILNAVCRDDKPVWKHKLEDFSDCQTSDPVYINA